MRKNNRGFGKRKIFIQLVILFMVILQSACGGNKKYFLKMDLQAADFCNNGNPVVIWIYQLRSDATYNSLSIETFVKSPQEALAGDMVGEVDERTVRPGTVVSLDKLSINSEARYLAIIADFVNPSANDWRLILPLEQNRHHEIAIECQNNNLTLIKQKK